jgi:uncharacterized glyoxalase superfamily protein PhnB
MQTIFPILRYRDARRAIESLCAAFDFVEVFSVPPAGDIVRHAQLRLGTNIIMLGSVRPEDSITTPQIAGVATQALCVFVEDIDAHYERARTSGIEITSELMATDFGAREYHARDSEGHPWTFTTYRPEPGA